MFGICLPVIMPPEHCRKANAFVGRAFENGRLFSAKEAQEKPRFSYFPV